MTIGSYEQSTNSVENVDFIVTISFFILFIDFFNIKKSFFS